MKRGGPRSHRPYPRDPAKCGANLSKSFTRADELGPGTVIVQCVLNDAMAAIPIIRSVSVLIRRLES
jgi:hypothetical protein